MDCRPSGPLSVVFPRQDYWSWLPFPSPGELPHSGIKPTSPTLAGGFFTTELSGKPKHWGHGTKETDKKRDFVLQTDSPCDHK